MAKLTKKQKAQQGKVETTKLYPLADALALVKSLAARHQQDSSAAGGDNAPQQQAIPPPTTR